MITKSDEHDIDRAGRRLLRSALEGIGWIVNNVDDDYGIDFNVQIFDEKVPTGAWFHVQLKSSAKSDYSEGGDFISQQLSVDHAKHYALEMRQPIVLIHCDVSAERVYWYYPQLDAGLIASLLQTSAKSVAVRIPTSSELPQTAPELLIALRETYVTLAARELASASTRLFAESLRRLPNQNELIRSFQDKNDILKLKRIVDLIRQQQFTEARPRAEAVVADPDANVEVRFWAEIQLQAIDYHDITHSGAPQNELAQSTLKHAKALQKLTKAGPRHLKFHALIARQAADLEVMVHENLGLFMAFRVHLRGGGNPMMALGLLARRSLLTRQIVNKYNKCVRLARYAANYSDRWALGRALTNIVKAIAHFISTLRFDGNEQSASEFALSALQICKLAAWISAETDDPEGIIVALTSSLLTIRSEDSDAYEWAKQTAQGLSDANLRADATQMVERATRRWKGEAVEGDYHGDTLWQAIQNMATGMGVDISDENSELVQQLKIAARDDSPERVLLNCEHLLAATGAIGPTAFEVRQIFGIQTAGSKVIHCTLHDYHIEAKDLDSAYSQFKQTYCNSCPDARPRPSDWHYDDSARQIEGDKFSDFVERFVGQEFGLRYSDKD